MYKVQYTRSAVKDLKKLPRSFVKRIVRRIRQLADNPRPSGVVKVKGYDQYYRLRVGDYRIVYGVGDEIRIVTIVKIGHRKDIYKLIDK